MHPVPRPSTRAGSTSRSTLLLAVAGVAMGVLLIVLFSQLTPSRAAAPGALLEPSMPPAENSPGEAEAVLATPEFLGEEPEAAPQLTAPATPPLPTGPKKPQGLRYAKDTGKAPRVDPKSLTQKFNARRGKEPGENAERKPASERRERKRPAKEPQPEPAESTPGDG